MSKAASKTTASAVAIAFVAVAVAGPAAAEIPSDQGSWQTLESQWQDLVKLNRARSAGSSTVLSLSTSEESTSSTTTSLQET